MKEYSHTPPFFFFDMLTTYDTEYRRIVENRLPSSYSPRYNKIDFFLPTTKTYLQSLFNLLLKTEAILEGWRQRLNKMSGFNSRLMFERIDRIDKGYIVEGDITNYFKRNDAEYLTHETDLVFFRIDTNKDGRISYIEFSEELYPKSKEYFI